MSHENDDVQDLPSSSHTLTVQPAPTRSAQQSHSFSAKIAELFLTAGHAFQKLGDLTVKLNAVNVDHEENRWTEKDIDNLRDAICRFANELDNVSGSLLTRSKKMIRTDIKRRTLQMGIEPGGTTLAGARTVLKPVSQVDPGLQTSLSLVQTTSKPGSSAGLQSSQAISESKASTSSAQAGSRADGDGLGQNGSTLNTTTSSLSSLHSANPQQPKAPFIKKVYVPGQSPGLTQIRRPGQFYTRGPLTAGPSSSIRYIPGQQFGSGRKLVVSSASPSSFVRVVNSHHDFDRQRPIAAARPKYQLNNGFVNEEIVYTSPSAATEGNGPVAQAKRAHADSNPVQSKAPKLEAVDG